MKLAFLLVGVAGLWAQQSSLTLVAPAPARVDPNSISTSATNRNGAGQQCYWVVANYASGKANAAGPTCIDRLQDSSTITIGWGGTGAVSYDVLRYDGAQLPSSTTNMLVGTVSGGTSTTDTVGSALTAYTVATGVHSAEVTLGVNNKDYVQPRWSTETMWNLPVLGTFTVATLPGSAPLYALAYVTNGASGSDCTTGGGSSLALCGKSTAGWISVGGGATALANLTDVTLTAPANTQILRYNGTKWVNSNDSASTIPDFTPSILGATATIAAGKFASTGVTYTVAQSTAVITAGAGAASGAVIYIDSAGTVHVDHPSAAGLTVVCTGCVQAAVATPAVPYDARGIGTMNTAGGAWTALTDIRSFFEMKNVVAGDGMLLDATKTTFTVDTTVARRDGTNTFTGENDFSAATSLRVKTGTGAPSATDCDAAAEVGRVQFQTGDPASIVTQSWRCAQTGASSYAWSFVGHQTGTALPAKCVTGQVFVLTGVIAGQNSYNCTATDTWTRQTAVRVAFDTTTLHIVEEFTGGPVSAGAGPWGTHGWAMGNLTGSGSTTMIASETNHPGILQLTSGANANDNSWVVMGATNTSLPAWSTWAVGTKAVFVFRIPANSATADLSVGIMGAGATDGMIATWNSSAGDTVFRFLSCKAGTCATAGNSTISLADNTWYQLTIIKTAASTTTFSINGEAPVTVTNDGSTNLPTATLRPAILIKTTTAANRILQIDYFELLMTGLGARY